MLTECIWDYQICIDILIVYMSPRQLFESLSECHIISCEQAM